MLRERAGQSGFGWDWINNKLSIDSEDVWIKYVAANKKAGFYKNKVIKNWDAITTIYSEDHANGEGAVTSAETVVEPTMEPNEASPEVPHKKQRTGDAILCLLGDMKGSFNDALKSLEPLPPPQVTPPAEILATLEMIPDLARGDILRSYEWLLMDNMYVYYAPAEILATLEMIPDLARGDILRSYGSSDSLAPCTANMVLKIDTAKTFTEAGTRAILETFSVRNLSSGEENRVFERLDIRDITT
uniref:Myb/SANT-like domain-containing protein n=1 Tax=Aegilops tauschii TaxID=37682 RepID=M8BAD0_AEGTA